MIRSLWTAASGMSAQQLNLDSIANNIANVNTTSFKKGRADFQDLLYQTLRAPGASASAGQEIPVGIEVGLGTRPVSIYKIFSQGDFKQTSNPLDLVIEGEGFFAITLPNGDTAYTRAGDFKKDASGQVITGDGYALDPAITIPSDALTVTFGTDGTVSVTQAGQAEASEVGTIQLANFVNPAGLKSLGRNLYGETAASGPATTGTPGQSGLGTIAQGFLEMSNVDLVEEMVSMIVGQRAYEANSKVIKTSDDMLQQVNGLRP
ncbi:MAG: flagellar basal-body rod protein FlgG [Candidatus Schekmanbacteria bacterium]|nr:flagellar basal-body rod protein FlgG [Candidatus Schekmanbacteria bacterium]